MSFEVFDNENAALGGGAGIQSAQFIAAKGAKALITGHCGPNAMQTLSAAGVQVYAGQAGTIQGIVDKFKNGELTPPPKPTHRRMPEWEAKGMGQGRGMGRGRGMGGGRGRLVGEAADRTVTMRDLRINLKRMPNFYR